MFKHVIGWIIIPTFLITSALIVLASAVHTPTITPGVLSFVISIIIPARAANPAIIFVVVNLRAKITVNNGVSDYRVNARESGKSWKDFIIRS